MPSTSTHFISCPRRRRDGEEKFMRTAGLRFSNAEQSKKSANTSSVALAQKKKAAASAAATIRLSTLSTTSAIFCPNSRDSKHPATLPPSSG